MLRQGVVEDIADLLRANTDTNALSPLRGMGTGRMVAIAQPEEGGGAGAPFGTAYPFRFVYFVFSPLQFPLGTGEGGGRMGRLNMTVARAEGRHYDHGYRSQAAASHDSGRT